MTGTARDTRRPSERVGDTGRLIRAMRRAVREALIAHKRDGDPIVVWRDGKVVWVPAEEIEIPDEEIEIPDEIADDREESGADPR